MGLNEKTKSNIIWLEIKYGSLCQVSKEPKDGWERHVSTNPKTREEVVKWLKRYKSVDGLVCDLKFRDTEGKYSERYMDWQLSIDADGIPVVLTIPLRSTVSDRFMNVAENINWNQRLEIKVWKDKENDKTAVAFYQNEVSVPSKYTRENPNGRPEPTQDAFGKWDFSKPTKWLFDRVMNYVIPAIQEAGHQMPQGPALVEDRPGNDAHSTSRDKPKDSFLSKETESFTESSFGETAPTNEHEYREPIREEHKETADYDLPF